MITINSEEDIMAVKRLMDTDDVLDPMNEYKRLIVQLDGEINEARRLLNELEERRG